MSTKWKHQVLKRKNFAPTFIITIALWISVILLIINTNPNQFAVVHLFFILFFLAVFLTSAILLVNTRRGILIALGITAFLFLRSIGAGSVMAAISLIAILSLVELYALVK